MTALDGVAETTSPLASLPLPTDFGGVIDTPPSGPAPRGPQRRQN